MPALQDSMGHMGGHKIFGMGIQSLRKSMQNLKERLSQQ
jgi:hypothetical protein